MSQQQREHDELVPDPKIREELGGLSNMTLWRYDQDPLMGFPRPVRIRGRKYRWRSAVDEWKRRVAANEVKDWTSQKELHRERGRSR